MLSFFNTCVGSGNMTDVWAHTTRCYLGTIRGRKLNFKMEILGSRIKILFLLIKPQIFTLGVICPQNLKSKVGQTGTSLRAGYRSRDALQKDEIYCRAREFLMSGQLLSTTYGCKATGRQSCPIFRFFHIFPIQNP